MVVDVREDFLGSRIVFGTNSVAVNAITQYGGSATLPNLTAPLDEAWYVHWVTGFGPNLGAGQTLQIAAGLRLVDTDSGTPTYCFGAASQVKTVGQACICDPFYPRMWIGPGMGAAIMCSELVAGPATCTLQMAYTPVKI